jgi:hypothetical protein
VPTRGLEFTFGPSVLEGAGEWVATRGTGVGSEGELKWIGLCTLLRNQFGCLFLILSGGVKGVGGRVIGCDEGGSAKGSSGSGGGDMAGLDIMRYTGGVELAGDVDEARGHVALGTIRMLTASSS